MRYLLQLGVLVVLLQGSISETFGQVTLNEYLLTAYQDADVKTIQGQISYLNSRPYQISYLQKLEFRTRSNQLDPQRQDYALRINPANPWEVRSNNAYYKEVLNGLRAEEQVVLREALKDRYEKAIEYFGLRELLELNEEVVRLMEKQELAADQLLIASTLDADDYIDVKLDVMDKLLELDEMRLQYLEASKSIRLEVGSLDLPNWDIARLISVDQIQKIVSGLSLDSTTHSEILERKSRVQLAEREYALEKSNINIGYLQTQYESYRIEQDRKPWSIGLGITIPIVNPNKGDMAKRRLESIEATHSLDETRREYQHRFQLLKEELDSLVGHYNSLGDRFARFENSELPGLLITSQNHNPLVGLKYQMSLIRFKIIRAKMRERILMTYVDFLDIADRLQQQPLINYLSSGLETMQP